MPSAGSIRPPHKVFVLPPTSSYTLPLPKRPGCPRNSRTRFPRRGSHDIRPQAAHPWPWPLAWATLSARQGRCGRLIEDRYGGLGAGQHHPADAQRQRHPRPRTVSSSARTPVVRQAITAGRDRHLSGIHRQCRLLLQQGRRPAVEGRRQGLMRWPRSSTSTPTRSSGSIAGARQQHLGHRRCARTWPMPTSW